MNARVGNIRGALGLKQPKAQARPDYLAAVRQLGCVICENWGFPQFTPTHAHHVICGRYGQRKTPDIMAISLCHHHHQGADGIHTRREWWVETFGSDHDYIAQTQDRLAHLLDGRKP